MKAGQEANSTSKKGAPWTLRRFLIFIFAVAMALFHIYAAGVRPLPGVQQRTTHLCFALVLIFLMFPFKTQSDESQEIKVANEFRPLAFLDVFPHPPFPVSWRLRFRGVGGTELSHRHA